MRPEPLPMGVRQAEGTLTFETKTSTYGWTCSTCLGWNPPDMPDCVHKQRHRDRSIGIVLLALVQAAETGAIDLAEEIRDLAHHLGAE